MTVLGNVWQPSGAPYVVETSDGRTITITIYEHGLTVADSGGVTNLAHVEEDPNDPTRLKIAGRWFRLDPS